MFFSKSHRYSLVEEGSDKKKREGCRHWLIYTSFSLLLVFFCLSSGTLGYALGRKNGILENARRQNSSLELEPIVHGFRYNRSFTEAPSSHTDQAWRAIFPVDGGFFIHPEVAPTRATFSAFHQLHCLDGLRGAYWKSHEKAIRGEKLLEEEIPMDMQPKHVRHCIDLLRQSLMCHADTTLEVVDEEIGGVHGFRVEHQCRNWEQLVRWTSEAQIKHSRHHHVDS